MIRSTATNTTEVPAAMPNTTVRIFMDLPVGGLRP